MFQNATILTIHQKNDSGGVIRMLKIIEALPKTSVVVLTETTSNLHHDTLSDTIITPLRMKILKISSGNFSDL
jgi:hypothetical protein